MMTNGRTAAGTKTTHGDGASMKSFIKRLNDEKAQVGKAMDLVRLCKLASEWVIDDEGDLLETPLGIAYDLLLSAHIEIAALAGELESPGPIIRRAGKIRRPRTVPSNVGLRKG